MTVYKPSICLHPKTGELSLNANLTAEISGLKDELRRALSEEYWERYWRIHRMYWEAPRLRSFSKNLRQLRSKIRARFSMGYKAIEEQPALPRIGSAFTSDIGRDWLAKLIQRHLCAFRWNSGDVLLIDNLKMAHMGMPGWGPRELRVLLCNPMKVPLASSASGVYSPEDRGDYVSLGERLVSKIGVAASVSS